MLQGQRITPPVSALNAWLEKNGFPTEDPEHMKYFVENKFTFLAIKINPPKGDRLSLGFVAKLATSPELHDSIGEIKETLIAVKKLARDVDSKVEPLATSLDQTLVEARAGIGDARKLMQSDIKEATDSAKTALDQAGQTLKGIERLSEEGTQLRHEISAALTEIAAASRSVRVLADFIEQHPDAILRGRAAQTGGQ